MPPVVSTRAKFPTPHQLASYLALYPGLYVAAALARFLELSMPHTSHLPLIPLLFVALTTTGIYLLDRVKLHNRLLDPADQAAEPHRFAFLHRHLNVLRLLSAALLISAAFIGRCFSPLAPIAVACSAAGVILYAPGPRQNRPRPKDIFILKNLYTATGLTTLVVATAIASTPTLSFLNLLPTLIAAIALFLRMILDALFCDIDDTESDSQYGTQTHATRLGPAKARNLALAAQLALILVTAAATPIPQVPRLIWAATSLASWGALLLYHPAKLREFIDLRLPAEATIATILLTLFQNQ